MGYFKITPPLMALNNKEKTQHQQDTKQEKVAKQWLKSLAKATGKWQKLAKMAALAQALMIVLQAAVLAKLLHAVIMDGKNAAELAAWFAVAAMVIILRYAVSWCREAAATKASLQAQQQLRSDLIDKLHELGPAWRAKQQGGALVSQLQEQVDAIDGYVAKFLPQMSLITTIPVFIIVAVAPLSWAAAVIFLFTAPLIPLFMALVGIKTKQSQIEQQQTFARMSGHFLDQIRGLPTLKLFNRHVQQIQVVAEVAENFRIRTMRVLRLAFLSSTVLEFFTSVSIAVCAVYLGFTFLGQLEFGLYGQSLSLGVAFFILLLAPEFYQPLRDLGTHYHAKAEAEAAAEQLYPWITTVSAQMRGGDRPPPPGSVDIALRQVDFAYADKPPLLQQADFILPAGQTTVLLGESGSGKTTLLRLLLGQLSPQSGQILIAEQPLESLAIHAWRAQIGWMSQHPHLLADSLAANLRLANAAADDAKLLQALNFVELDGWFADLPQGLQTRLGEGGRRLSGGQLRRLALARVYLTDAQVLLFDEPTASLDEDLEALLLAKMQQLCRHKTVLLLTHRSAPLALADGVALLGDGKLQVGSLAQMASSSAQIADWLKQQHNLAEV